MLVIRLQRTGRKNLATYRIVVAEKARAAKGHFHEIIGHYLPTRTEPVFTVEADRVEHWVKQGAIPSDTAARLFKKNGLKGMDKFVQVYTKRRSKNAPAEEPAATPAPAAAPAAEATPEAPVAETPVETPAAEPVVEAAAAETPAEETPAA
jgi:small subunit ribosomal protein S16